MNDDKNTLNKLRGQLLANGYSPIPNRDKACFLKNWPKVTIDEDTIAHWGRMRDAKATGLRVENGLCVIDIDVNHRVIEDVVECMLGAIPEDLRPERLERQGKGEKLAWYCRTDDLFARLHTRRWIAPGNTEDDETACVEIFGGGSPRQFGSFGPHTIDHDGKVKVSYRWTDESPADVPLHALDVLSKDQLFAMLDAAEGELKRQGWVPVARTKRGEGAAGRVYDLNEDMLFDMADGRTLGLKELQALVSDGYTGRCSASWLEGPAAANRQRCLVAATGAGHLVIWETSEGVSHMAAALKPTDFKAQVDRVAEKLREKQDKRRARLVDGDDHVSGAAKLLLSYAYQPNAKPPVVVPLWSNTDDDAMSMVGFRTAMLPYCGVEIGPRGGEKKINPVDVWLSNPNRIIIAGRRMRPDRERPVFEEYGETWLNTYRPPDLGAADGGTPDGGVMLLEQLVPDPRERAWFRQWLAFKWKYPHIPGPAIIMVARDFGTGRGTFGTFLKMLFGDRYVVNVPFKIYAGLSYQSQYTDWGLDALFAIVNESSTADDGKSEYRTKHDVYEHLKEVAEPRQTERTYIRKREGSVRAMASTSSLIMTNNVDALPLPPDDRRFAVLTNGEKRDPEFWAIINAWMGKQANIAAFAQWLEATDLDTYDPYDVPIQTRAKTNMVHLSKSPLDFLIDDAIEEMDGYFVPEQVMRKMAEGELRMKMDLPSGWRAIALREIRRRAHAVYYPNGRKLMPQIAGRRYEVMHKNQKEAARFDSAVDVRTILGRNGNVFGDGDGRSAAQKSVLRVVKNDTDGV